MSTGLGVTLAITCVAAYLLGTFPTATIIARRHGIPDLRRVGDHNPGFWNAAELLGWRPALPILIGDIAKGTIGAALGAVLVDRWWAPFATGGAAMVGHAFPVWSAGRGGRSVATFIGVAPVIAPLAAGVAVTMVFVPVWAVGRRFDRAVRVAVAAFPVAQLAIDGPVPTAATGVLMTFVGVRFAQASVSERRRPAADPAT